MGELRAIWDSIEILGSINTVSQVILTVLVLLTFLLSVVVNATSWRKEGLQRIEDLRQGQAIADANRQSTEATVQAGLANERASKADERTARLEVEAEGLRAETEAAKLARAQIEERLADRTISDTQAVAIQNKVSQFAGQEYSVVTFWELREPLALANRLHSTLSSSGWTFVKREGFLLGGTAGIQIYIHPKAGSATVQATRALIQALEAANLAPSLRTISPQDELTEKIHINVGTKP